jgi:NADH-quinone oxidoreductase subunit M
VIFGVLTKPDIKAFLDLSPREVAIFAPLIAIMLWMGIYPSSFIDVMSASVANVVDHYHTSLAAAEQPSLAALWLGR